MNDPQVLGTVFMLAGYCFYFKRPDSTAWLAAPAIALVLGLFTQHNLPAIPAAVAIHMLAERRSKRFAIWISTAALASAILPAATLKIDGPYIFSPT
ncbi:MAG: hypothetical protein LAO79_29460 [Acidobacteriia bacterium]|nr:hypothetical protein [Terriglobia bacterium]